MKLKELLYAKFDHDQTTKDHRTHLKSLQNNILSALDENRVEKKKAIRWVPIAARFAFIIFVVAVINAVYFKKNTSPIITKLTPTDKPLQKISNTPSTSPTSVPHTPTNITLATGFGFNLPDSWSAKISDQTKDHFAGRFFIPGADNSTSYVEIESIQISQQTLNPFIQSQNKRDEYINGNLATIIEGKENFRNSNRLIKQVSFASQDKILTLTLYKNPGDTFDSQFEQLVKSIQTNQKTAWWKSFSIQIVHAAEAIAGFDKEKYQRIEVMTDPIEVPIISKDAEYKDGYAKLYVFDAFKGQRLTTVAQEKESRSYIRSELYDQTGQQLYSQDTRIEFEAPYTGKYYLIVRTFNSQEGAVLFKVFDRNQTENLTYLKYADGSEVLIDYNKRPPQYGDKEAALIMQFISPVDVIDDQSVRFIAKPREFEPNPGLVTVPIRLYAKPGTYQEDIINGTHLPEDSAENLQKIKITKLTPSKIIIEPQLGGLFPKNYHFNLTLYVPVDNGLASYGGGRFFLENTQK